MTEGMSVARELMQDHGRIEKLITRANALPPGTERNAIIREACTDYLRHAVAEEQVLLPALREHLIGGAENAGSLIQGEQEISANVEELVRADGYHADPAYEAAFAGFSDGFARHVENLDSGLLPALSDACLPEKMNHLGRRLRTAKEQAVVEPLAERAHHAAAGTRR
jgi:hypothetical protein